MWMSEVKKRELTMSFGIENNSFSVAQVKVDGKCGGRRRSRLSTKFSTFLSLTIPE